tara:strand:- start:158 stop:850 length:693 start_codon:yes stop_codon:yes gene_type:complete
MSKKYLCIIPARGGSKGIKNKNILNLKKKPLIQYTIDIAKKLKDHSEIVVSTDSLRISKIIKKNKLNFFGLRPKKLSSDYALTKDVVKFELKRIEKKLNKKFYAIILLQPTCPIRKIETLNKAIKFLNQNLFDSVVSVSEVGACHPYRMKIFKNRYLKNFMHFKGENMLPRQKLPKIYIRSGSFYLIKRDAFLKYNSLVGKKCKGIILKGLEAVNIDKKEDFDYLKLKIK